MFARTKEHRFFLAEPSCVLQVQSRRKKLIIYSVLGAAVCSVCKYTSHALNLGTYPDANHFFVPLLDLTCKHNCACEIDKCNVDVFYCVPMSFFILGWLGLVVGRVRCRHANGSLSWTRVYGTWLHYVNAYGRNKFVYTFIKACAHKYYNMLLL
jgi:hypothetical protein